MNPFALIASTAKSRRLTHPLKLVAAILTICVLTPALAQQKEFTLLQYLEKANESDDLKLGITNTLVLDGMDVAPALRQKGYAVDEMNRVIIDAPFFIKDAAVRGNTFEYEGVEERHDHLFIDGLHFKSSFEISLADLNSFEIRNCSFDAPFIIRLKSDRIMVDIANNQMFAAGSIRIENGQVSILNNEFKLNPEAGSPRYVNALYGVPRAILFDVADSLSEAFGNIYRPTDFYENLQLSCVSCDFFSVEENTFTSTQSNYIVYLNVKSESFSLSENDNQGSFQLSGAVEKDFRVGDNHVDGFFMFDSFNYPEDALILWSDIQNKVAIPSSMYGKQFITVQRDTVDIYIPTIYTGRNRNDDVLNQNEFNQLLFTHKLIHSSYVKRGNLEDANNCFVAIKDLEAQKLKARVEANGNFRNWIRYKLNRLMKFYTNHGTDPGLAIQISIYLILIFSLVYFFFPSDWDSKPKAELWMKMKELKGLRGKPLVKSFFSWIYLLLFMFVNAFTLSLNVFVTLGFGNIPTHGIARHLCIVQGFLGWFLLSLFSVALINQILF